MAGRVTACDKSIDRPQRALHGVQRVRGCTGMCTPSAALECIHFGKRDEGRFVSRDFRILGLSNFGTFQLLRLSIIRTIYQYCSPSVKLSITRTIN